MSRYRLLYLGLGLGLVAVIALSLALQPTGEPVGAPEVIEAFEPQPGDQVLRQTAIVVDLPVGYDIELWVQIRGNTGGGVSWLRVPDTEIDRDQATQTGVFTWRPGSGRALEEWAPGLHRVRVVWDTVTGLPDRGQFEWEFRSF